MKTTKTICLLLALTAVPIQAEDFDGLIKKMESRKSSERKSALNTAKSFPPEKRMDFLLELAQKDDPELRMVHEKIAQTLIQKVEIDLTTIKDQDPEVIDGETVVPIAEEVETNLKGFRLNKNFGMVNVFHNDDELGAFLKKVYSDPKTAIRKQKEINTLTPMPYPTYNLVFLFNNNLQIYTGDFDHHVKNNRVHFEIAYLTQQILEDFKAFQVPVKQFYLIPKTLKISTQISTVRRNLN